MLLIVWRKDSNVSLVNNWSLKHFISYSCSAKEATFLCKEGGGTSATKMAGDYHLWNMNYKTVNVFSAPSELLVFYFWFWSTSGFLPAFDVVIQDPALQK